MRLTIRAPMLYSCVAIENKSERNIFMKKNNIYEMVSCAFIAAIICIFAPMSVPIGPIPVSLTNLVLYFGVFILSTRSLTVAYMIYLLLGAVGLPVFSGYAGGLGKLAGPTGGYLIGFIPMIIIMCILYNKQAVNKKMPANIGITVLGMIVGTVVAYAFGTAWFVFQMECTIEYALTVCVLPFIPFDLAKIVIANIIGRTIRKPLKAQGLI